MDRSPGASGSAIHYAVGGALATLGALFFFSAGNPHTNIAKGNVVYIKATGTLTITTSIWISDVGNDVIHSAIIGYGTTRGDNGQVTITTSTNSVHIFTCQGANRFDFYNLILTNTAGTRGNGFFCNFLPNAYSIISNCVLNGFVNGIDSVTSTSWQALTIINTEIKNCSSNGLLLSGYAQVVASYIHDNSGDGIQITGGLGHVYCIEVVCANNGGAGFRDNSSDTSRYFFLKNCVSYNNTGDGVKVASSSGVQGLFALNCIFYGNGGFGVNFPSVTSAILPGTFLLQWNNALGSNTSGSRNTGLPAGVTDIALTANPFTSPSTGDFSLNNTAGGGAASKGAAFQSTLI